MTLTVSGEDVTFAYKDFDMHAADSTVVQDICQIGTKGNLIRRYKELSDVKNNKAEFTLKFEYDHNKRRKLSVRRQSRIIKRLRMRHWCVIPVSLSLQMM